MAVTGCAPKASQLSPNAPEFVPRASCLNISDDRTKSDESGYFGAPSSPPRTRKPKGQAPRLRRRLVITLTPLGILSGYTHVLPFVGIFVLERFIPWHYFPNALRSLKPSQTVKEFVAKGCASRRPDASTRTRTRDSSYSSSSEVKSSALSPTAEAFIPHGCAKKQPGDSTLSSTRDSSDSPSRALKSSSLSPTAEKFVPQGSAKRRPEISTRSSARESSNPLSSAPKSSSLSLKAKEFIPQGSAKEGPEASVQSRAKVPSGSLSSALKSLSPTHQELLLHNPAKKEPEAAPQGPPPSSSDSTLNASKSSSISPTQGVSIPRVSANSRSPAPKAEKRLVRLTRPQTGGGAPSENSGVDAITQLRIFITDVTLDPGCFGEKIQSLLKVLKKHLLAGNSVAEIMKVISDYGVCIPKFQSQAVKMFKELNKYAVVYPCFRRGYDLKDRVNSLLSDIEPPGNGKELTGKERTTVEFCAKLILAARGDFLSQHWNLDTLLQDRIAVPRTQNSGTSTSMR